MALDTPAGPATLAALDAVWGRGDAALPLPPDLTAPERAATLARLRPTSVRTTAGEAARTAGVPVPDGTALLVTTSGSTGTPSAVALSHAALAAMVAASRARLGAADGVPWLGVLPLHHVAGIGVVLRSRAAGCEPVLHPRDDAAVLAAAEPSWVSLVPTQLARLLDADADLARHAGVLLGGAAADDALLARAAAAGVRVVTSYGSTETCGGCVYDGVPLDGVEVRVDADGRVHVRGPVLASGRRTDAGALAPLVDADGWYATGDRGRLAPDGRLELLGRIDRVVVSGGENVPADRVEAAVRGVDGVAEVAVVGLPDPTWGSAVTAVVVPVRPDAPPTLDQLRRATAALLPGGWRPTRLVLATDLPRDGMGKVTAGSVASALAAGHAV